MAINYFFSRRIVIMLIMLALSACGSEKQPGSGSSFPGNEPELYWSSAIPDFQADPDAPQITLSGPEVIFLAVNEDYIEHGAMAIDPQDGDISSDILITNYSDQNMAGDYFVRYQVQDASGKFAQEKVRIVRIFNDKPASMMKRPVGATQSHLGYIESLPADYGYNTEQRFPLLIFNHGSAANVEISGNIPHLALDSIIAGTGPAWLQSREKWDTSMPFITLSPQMNGIGDGKEMERLNAFIDYAIQTYKVDTSRIYITGWSQGGFLSFLYAATYPERVAAAVSISGGLPFQPGEAPDDICNIETVPVWAFHGTEDNVVSVDSSVRTIDYINQNCQPMVLPKLTLFQQQQHAIHHAIFDLRAMESGALNLNTSPDYDPYDISLYNWLLQYQTDVVIP